MYIYISTVYVYKNAEYMYVLILNRIIDELQDAKRKMRPPAFLAFQLTLIITGFKTTSAYVLPQKVGMVFSVLFSWRELFE